MQRYQYVFYCLSTLTTKNIIYVKDIKFISRPQEFYRVVTSLPVLKFPDPSLYEVLFSIDIISKFY